MPLLDRVVDLLDERAAMRMMSRISTSLCGHLMRFCSGRRTCYGCASDCKHETMCARALPMMLRIFALPCEQLMPSCKDDDQL